MERAYHAHLDGGEGLRVARCAFWIAINLILRGRRGGATGWVGRARRIVDRQERDCVERGYLLLADMFDHEAAGARRCGPAPEVIQGDGEPDLGPGVGVIAVFDHEAAGPIIGCRVAWRTTTGEEVRDAPCHARW